MGIKTYTFAETVDILKSEGKAVKLAGNNEYGALYVPGKLLLKVGAGLFQLFTEEEPGVSQVVLSTTDEDDACREVLRRMGVKTIKHKIKKVEAENE